MVYNFFWKLSCLWLTESKFTFKIIVSIKLNLVFLKSKNGVKIRKIVKWGFAANWNWPINYRAWNGWNRRRWSRWWGWSWRLFILEKFDKILTCWIYNFFFWINLGEKGRNLINLLIFDWNIFYKINSDAPVEPEPEVIAEAEPEPENEPEPTPERI